MAAAGAIMGVAGGLVGAYGAQKAGAEAEQEAQFNAAVQRQEGEFAVQQATEDERRQRVQSRYALGGMRAAIGASGIQRDGSALDVLQDSASNAEMDALTIRHKGQLAKWAAETNAQMSEFQGAQAKEQAKFAAAGQVLGAGGSAAKGLGGGAKAHGGPSKGGYAGSDSNSYGSYA